MSGKRGNPNWLPGTSGNPGGRPKEAGEVKELARKHTKAAVETLVSMLNAENERTRVAAAEAILDRGWGRPAQAVTGDNGEGPVTIVVQTGIARE